MAQVKGHIEATSAAAVSSRTDAALLLAPSGLMKPLVVLTSGSEP